MPRTTASLEWSVDGPADGATNMAIDRALLARADEDAGPVRLRVYAWAPPAVSLGFHQDPTTVDHDALARDGLGCVARPTGGAAVLHDREITYAVVGPLGVPGLGRRVLEIHDAIAGALQDALGALGVTVAREGSGRPEGFACFAAAGGHEITAHGRKLVGSALRRARHAFLQHGSLLVGPGHEQLPRYVAGSDPATHDAAIDALRARTITLEDLGHGAIDPRDFARALADALGGRLDLPSREVD